MQKTGCTWLLAAVVTIACSCNDNGHVIVDYFADECTTDDECPSDQKCDGEWCVSRTGAGGVCEESSACLPELECIANDAWQGSLCTTECDDGCPDNTACHEGFCLMTCNDISECLTNVLCVDGFCSQVIEDGYTTTEEVTAIPVD